MSMPTMIGRFEPHHAVNHVVVAGLGGTGSQLARSVARIIYDMQRRGLHTPRILFVDPDVVEPENVGRQSAVSHADAGQPKAELLARRFNYALGLNIAWASEAYDPDKHASGHSTLLLGAVDNHEARRALVSTQNVIYIDAGNHHDAGQAVIGSSGDRDRVIEAIEAAEESGTTSVLPNIALVFPPLLEPPLEEDPGPDTLSCAERIERGQQHLLVNDLVATICAGYVYRFLHRQPITSFLNFVDLDTLAARPIPITKENVLTYMDSV
jgi:PRTRC genetic system ThiF family protein